MRQWVFNCIPKYFHLADPGTLCLIPSLPNFMHIISLPHAIFINQLAVSDSLFQSAFLIKMVRKKDMEFADVSSPKNFFFSILHISK